ncbi:MAG: hypothetical protein V4793_13730, partial [Paraburkholderia tropica]
VDAGSGRKPGAAEAEKHENLVSLTLVADQRRRSRTAWPLIEAAGATGRRVSCDARARPSRTYLSVLKRARVPV